jgi:sporulation protein YlmC with PRC-barrel domain
MRKLTLFGAAAGAAVLLATLAPQPGHAQGVPQSVVLTRVDPATLATGYRTSKVVGSHVVNELGDAVGTIDDLIVTPSDRVPFAVISVGGFLGMDRKLVVVPYSSLSVGDNKMMLKGATKESVKALPEFKYAS